MQRSIKKFLLALAFVLSSGLAFGQQETISYICRCVEGGVNTQLVEWLREHVFPGFEERMQAEGRDVQVELIEFGGSDEALAQQQALDLSVGAGADILGFDGFLLPEFVEAGYLRPLDEVVGEHVWEWEGWNHIPEGLLGLLGFQGETYGLGLGTDVRMIFYRTDLFEDAGLDVPWQPTSWDDVLAAARQIKEALPEVTPLQLNAGTVMGEATTMQGYFMALLGTGTHMYDFDTGTWVAEHPGILDTLNLYQTIYVDEELGDARLQLITGGREASFEGFRDGRIAMLVEGDFFWRSVMAPGSEWEPAEGREAVVSWAKMPAQEPGMGYGGRDFVSISGGTGVVINPNTRHPDLAWELISFMFGEEMQLAFQEIQPRIRIRDDIEVIGDPEMSRMAEELLPLSTVRPQLPEYPRISDEAQRMTERVISGEMTPEEAMAAYAQAVEEIVGAENVVRE